MGMKNSFSLFGCLYRGSKGTRRSVQVLEWYGPYFSFLDSEFIGLIYIYLFNGVCLFLSIHVFE